ncbi:fumarylacetoacetate hydrolase family protein [Agrococcus sp. ARC_14]|uniref:fumarylacetoacetate hydrolase family protein n=1 Tax=Agrococcus sp. ARC_14 TaxID=2919927 RepID=UPI001F05C832|nr:fumarylacetoacetate hydrolase family protein [Agrococcus sp. ARC_14]MCH1881486.1 fumarylacetoacetate hydrolase family protein [Agrococcus sp. ARC_14]
MRFQRLGEPGAEIPVLVDGERRLDLRGITTDIDGTFLAGGGVERAKAALATGELPELEGAAAMRVGAPIARPTAVLCIGQNYAAHAAESGDAAPEVPILFFKHPNTVVGPEDDVAIPPNAATVDWEVELGIVIGTRARYLASDEEALASIAGFVVSNDVSEREFQTKHSGGQWSKGKCAETFNPLGPELVTADEVEVQSLRLWSKVNGEPRQDSSTADMIFPVAEIVRHLSQYLVLEPGDLINTGTPQGVALSGRFPYLVAGDVMEIGIEGLGQQRQRLVPAVI